MHNDCTALYLQQMWMLKGIAATELNRIANNTTL